MRRAILAITGTIAGLVALLSFKSHDPALPVASTSGTGGGSSATSSAAPAAAGAESSSGSVPGEFPTGSVAGSLAAGETAVTGNVAQTAYGPVQVQLVVKSGKIVKVAILKQPTTTMHDIQIGEFAFPRLISETLSAQDAKIDSVSGASYTSAGYISSLQNALDRGV
jgi:uncharacterized protein with FMN-binding domain